jgi:hypothetical protein
MLSLSTASNTLISKALAVLNLWHFKMKLNSKDKVEPVQIISCPNLIGYGSYIITGFLLIL